jgi:hypothetical protein
MTKDQAKSSKTIESRFELTSILNEMRSTLGNQESCTATLGGMDAQSTPAGSITKIVRFNPSGNVDMYESDVTGNGQFYGNGTTKIISYRLESTDTLDPSIGIPAGSTQGIVNLIITFNFGSPGRTYSSNSMEKKIRINVTTTTADTDYTIISCGSMGSAGGDFVEIAGDEMTGDLIMSANIEIKEGFEINFTSDRRYKYDIQKINSSLNSINNLRPVHFKWKTNSLPSDGFIAQELKETFPLMVNQNEDGSHTIKMVQLTPHLVRSIQELSVENKKLKNEIELLKKEQAQIKALLMQ